MKSRYLQQGMYAAVFTVAAVQVNAASPVDFSNLVEQVSPAVVSVNVVKKMTQEELLQQQVPEILRRFFGNQVIIPQQQGPQEKTAYGSAFFISKDGYLVTNHHVIADASRISITLNDRRELDATLVGSDERTDVAVLKVNGANFPELKVGNVSQLKVGEPVLAIGSPFGFDYSASAGIVSAKSRNMSGETSVPFIQTDAALNPGNSGGPLFNQRGEVVGVNSRIFSGTGGYMGLSFSIPIDVAMDVVQQLKTNGKVTRSYLGVMLQDIDRNLAEAYKLPKPEGSLINQVTPKSPAEKAGLKSGDVILKINGSSISRTSDLLNVLNRVAPSQTIRLEILRDDKIRTISA
ncbi:MAG: trypsin-like peptidase domain-containing protein, partial [Acinetobacter sp.]